MAVNKKAPPKLPDELEDHVSISSNSDFEDQREVDTSARDVSTRSYSKL